jgi:molybdate transport system substrate-binding protein
LSTNIHPSKANGGEPVKSRLSVIALVALTLGISTSTRAQNEITLLAPNPIKSTIDKLVENFQAKTGKKIKVTYGTGVGTRKTVASGGALDVTLLFAPYQDALKTGNVVPGSAMVVAQLRLAIAVKKGAPKPDISSVAAVKKTLLNAKSIISVDPAQGTVGGAVLLALDKMGIADQVSPKIKWVRGGGEVQDSVANGETELAFGPYLSDMRNPGLDVVGALPLGASTPVDITGFLSTTVRDPKAARTFLTYLRSKESAPMWEAAKAFPIR